MQLAQFLSPHTLLAAVIELLCWIKMPDGLKFVPQPQQFDDDACKNTCMPYFLFFQLEVKKRGRHILQVFRSSVSRLIAVPAHSSVSDRM